MRRGIAAVAGCRIEGVESPRSKLRPLQIRPALPALRRRLVGRRIEAVDRIGKRVVLILDSGDRLIIEPRMTGRVLLADPPNRSHLRLVIRLDGGPGQLLFWDVRGLGVVSLVAPQEFVERLGPQKLGPDALSIVAEELRTRMASSRRAIKVALLDQRALVGIGNLYASEILHRAGIHPAVACNRLRRDQWNTLHAQIREVLAEAIDCQGSTLSDGTYGTPSGTAGEFQEHHRVYQRAGLPCTSCGKTAIVRIVQAQRSTFFCPACQPPRRSARST